MYIQIPSDSKSCGADIIVSQSLIWTVNAAINHYQVVKHHFRSARESGLLSVFRDKRGSPAILVNPLMSNFSDALTLKQCISCLKNLSWGNTQFVRYGNTQTNKHANTQRVWGFRRQLPISNGAVATDNGTDMTSCWPVGRKKNQKAPSTILLIQSKQLIGVQWTGMDWNQMERVGVENGMFQYAVE